MRIGIRFSGKDNLMKNGPDFFKVGFCSFSNYQGVLSMENIRLGVSGGRIEITDLDLGDNNEDIRICSKPKYVARPS